MNTTSSKENPNETIQEIEILSIPSLDTDQAALLDMHSLLNVLNVMIGELNLIGFDMERNKDLEMCYGIAEDLKSGLTDKIVTLHQLERLEDKERVFFRHLDAATEQSGTSTEDSEIKESRQNLRSVFNVLKVRAQELIVRAKEPEVWKPFSISQLTENFTKALAAIEKNAKGRYRIIYNVAAQQPVDYLIDLKIESVDGPTITMPPVLQDVFRDLIANARKYTQPGGHIHAGLLDDGEEIKMVVQDNGRGIPSEELAEVVQFKKRGSNVLDSETRGGGFGLTKAFVVTRQFGGRMWIKSALNHGTRITIRIPRC